MKTQAQKKRGLLPLAKKIAAFIQKEGSGPTVREVSAMRGGTSAGHGMQLVKKLEEAGFITREPGKARSISLTENYQNL